MKKNLPKLKAKEKIRLFTRWLFTARLMAIHFLTTVISVISMAQSPPPDGSASCPNDGPPAFFKFASDSGRHGIFPETIKSWAQSYKKKGGVLIGADTGDASFKTNLDACKQTQGCKFHCYLEGPSGPTGDRGTDPKEAARAQERAKKVGMDASSQQWKDEGFIQSLEKFELEQYKDCDSYEVDNISEASWHNNPEKMISFLDRMNKALQRINPKGKILLKNLDSTMMSAVCSAIQKTDLHSIPRERIADFSIQESGTGDATPEAAKCGIQNLKSDNTYDYDAYGEYNAGCKPKPAASTDPGSLTPFSQPLNSAGVTR